MRVLTWNLLAHEWIKPHYFKHISPTLLFNRKGRLGLIVSRLMYLDPDVMGLQEVMPAEYNALQRLFGHTHYITRLYNIMWGKTPSKSGNVILIRKTLCKTIDQNFAQWPFGHACIFVPKHSNTPVLVVNVHLDNKDIRRRYAQVGTLQPMLEAASHVIWLGDFNHHYRSNTRLYHLVPNFKIHNTAISYFVDRECCIDNILTKNFIANEATVRAPVILPTEEKTFQYYGSDHLPIQAELTLQTTD